MYTNDERFAILHTPGSNTWTLQIKFVQRRDHGMYECQVGMIFFFLFPLYQESIHKSIGICYPCHVLNAIFMYVINQILVSDISLHYITVRWTWIYSNGEYYLWILMWQSWLNIVCKKSFRIHTQFEFNNP